MSSPAEVVEQLAESLDQDDFEAAGSVMAERVEYSVGNEVLVGPNAVVDSYRTASGMAHRLFDRVEYGHTVWATDDPNTFRISYSDTLTVSGETLTHMAEQRVTVDPDKGVIRIVNVELPGEREKVDGFLQRHGLTRER